MWEMEKDGVYEEEKRSQLGHQYLAHQSFCQQGKCVCFVELWFPVDVGLMVPALSRKLLMELMSEVEVKVAEGELD